MSGAKILKLPVGLEADECPICLIDFAVPAAFALDRRKTSTPYFCPRGHQIERGEGVIVGTFIPPDPSPR